MKDNQTKAQLLDCAVQLLQEDDLEALSLRKLSQKLGLTTGAFYKHFKNKTELLTLAMQRLSQQITQQFEQQIGSLKDLDAQETLVQLGKFFVDYFVQHPQLVNALFFSEIGKAALQQTNGQFALLNLTRNLIHQLNVNPAISDDVLFIQSWSFIQGYALLVQKQVVSLDLAIIRQTLCAFMQGEN